MKVEKEMKYVTPEVEILEVMVEKGFEGSTSADVDVDGGDWWWTWFKMEWSIINLIF